MGRGEGEDETSADHLEGFNECRELKGYFLTANCKAGNVGRFCPRPYNYGTTHILLGEGMREITEVEKRGYRNAWH